MDSGGTRLKFFSGDNSGGDGKARDRLVTACTLKRAPGSLLSGWSGHLNWARRFDDHVEKG